MNINSDFLKTGESWSSLDIQNLDYSFSSSLPAYYALAASHFLDFAIGTETQFSLSSDPNSIDQQDIVRYLLDDPASLSGYSGNQTVNTVLVNSVDYRVSFSDVVTASFSENTTGTGEIVLLNQDAYSASDPSKAYIPTTVNQTIGNAGDVFMNSLDTNIYSTMTPGDYGFWLHLHELGHAIGGLEDVINTAQAGTSLDNQKYTMMSYDTYGGVYASGLQLLDIAALQDTYGTTNISTRSGDTTYSLGNGLGFDGATASDAFLYTIWDGSGNDTIDASGFDVAVEIDLREGHFSSIGRDANGTAWNIDAAATPFDPDPGNVAIAYGTEIENAIGTAYADNIIGNALGNVITGGAGNDTLDGQGGTDTYVYNLGDGNDVINETSYENDIINLGGSITPGSFDISTINDDLVLTFSDNGTLTIKNAALDSVDLGFVYEDPNNPGQTVAGDLFVGTGGNDSLANSSFSNFYNDPAIAFGKGGDDIIGGSSGDDFLDGGAGNDNIRNLNGGNDTIYGGQGDDTIIVRSSNLSGQESYVYGGEGNDNVTVSWRNSLNDFYLDDISGNDTYSLSSNGFTSIHVTDSSGADFYNHITVNNSLIEITDTAGDDVYSLAPIRTGTFIIDDQGGVDELDFKMNYVFFNGTSQSGNDLNIHTTLGGTVTIKDYYLGSLHATELVSFNDTDAFDIDLLVNATNAVIGTNANDASLNGNANDNTILGFDGDDVLSGGAGNDELNGGNGTDTANYSSATAGIVSNLHTGSTSNDGDGGVDTLISIENITGSANADIITGSDGANVITTGDGGDIVQGRAGDDMITGGIGADILYGGNDNDTIYAGAGNDSDVRGENGDDTLFGEAGNDTLRGGAGNDTLDGGDDNDTLIGNDGDDTFIASAGNDVIDGGADVDTLDYSSWGQGVTANLFSGAINEDGVSGTDDNVIGIENFIGSDFADTITGNDAVNTINAGGGNDLIYARDDDDILYGDDGNDVIWAVGGDDIISGGSGSDTLRGQAGADTFIFMSGETGVDTIEDFSTAQNDVLNIADILVGYDPLADAITDFVQITDSGSNSVVSVDADGGADNFVQIATLLNITGLTDEAALETNGTLVTV